MTNPTPTTTAVPAVDLDAFVTKAINRAFNLGQKYWQEADSDSYAANRRSVSTLATFNTFRDETTTALLAEVRALRAEVIALRADNERLAKESARLFKQVEIRNG